MPQIQIPGNDHDLNSNPNSELCRADVSSKWMCLCALRQSAKFGKGWHNSMVPLALPGFHSQAFAH